jgi:Crp-like helix-turn-helix domain
VVRNERPNCHLFTTTEEALTFATAGPVSQPPGRTQQRRKTHREFDGYSRDDRLRDGRGDALEYPCCWARTARTRRLSCRLKAISCGARVRDLERKLRSDSPLAQITRRYVQAFFVQAAQSAACLRFHQIEQRLCRWILESHDRVGEAIVPLTQEFLALMLGVQRPGVTLAAAQLQKAGLITYRRGVIEVIDREGLEASSCECYAIVRTEYERLLC